MQIRPLGGGPTRRTDTRIVMATNRNLDELVAEGRLRQDLYFRMSKFRIQIPPLREQAEDIPGLIRFMLGANETARGRRAWLISIAMGDRSCSDMAGQATCGRLKTSSTARASSRKEVP